MVDHDRYSTTLSSEREFNSILFVLFIPSKDKDDNDLHDQPLWANAAGDLFTKLFGGATEMPPARGKWYNEESGEIITEDVILLHSYARAGDAADDDKIRQIAGFCHRMGRETRQGEVALLIDGIFHRMRSF